MVWVMIASKFLFSVYAACFIYINPVEIGTGVKVCGHFDWIGQCIKVKGDDNYSGIYDGHKYSRGQL